MSAAVPAQDRNIFPCALAAVLRVTAVRNPLLLQNQDHPLPEIRPGDHRVPADRTEAMDPERVHPVKTPNLPLYVFPLAKNPLASDFVCLTFAKLAWIVLSAIRALPIIARYS